MGEHGRMMKSKKGEGQESPKQKLSVLEMRMYVTKTIKLFSTTNSNLLFENLFFSYDSI